MKISTRIAESADFPGIVRLWKRFMAEEEEAVPDANSGEAADRWAERLRRQIADSKALVAHDGRALVGFVAFVDHEGCEWVPPGIAYVVDFYVAPEARASTAARELFRAATGLFQAGYSETWTNTHRSNRRVRVLLERAGFEPLSGFEIEGLQDQFYFRRGNERHDRGSRLRLPRSHNA